MSFVVQETAECRNLQAIHLKSSGWQIHSAFALSHMGWNATLSAFPQHRELGGLMRATILGVIGLICVATTAQGQLVGLNELWNVPGIIADVFGTVITCTNRTTASATIGIDMYGPSGSCVCGGSITTASGATVIIATGAYPNTSVDVNQACGVITKGYARIYSSTKSGILCSAYLVNSVNGSPVSSLTIAKKTKQKGD